MRTLPTKERVITLCGLIGVVGNLFEKDKKAFETMLKLDTIRGPHSTGVARVHENGGIDLVKAVGTPWDLIEQKPEEFYNGKGRTISGAYKLLMGHNRWATIGVINEDNAHPFKAGNIVGAHNGTLWSAAQRKLYKNEQVGTDSQAVMENLNHNGVEDTFSKLEGAWALTWYDAEDDTFNIVRNKERPLYYSYNKKGDVLYYASEPWIIFTAAERHDIDLKDPDRVFSIGVDTHYKWKVGPSYKFGTATLTTEERPGYKWVAPYVEKKSGVVTATGPFPASVNTSNVSSALQNVMEGRAKGPTAHELAQFWGPKKGQFVEFKLGIGWKKDEQQKQYLQCFTVLKETEIRIYPTLDDIMPKLGAADADAFTAKIKKVKFKPSRGGQVYITIDTATLEIAGTEPIDDEIPWVEDPLDRALADVREDTIINADRQEISAQEFMKITDGGCAWCSYQPLPCDSHGLVWIKGTSEFLCEDCTSNEHVKEYITQYTN